MMSGGIKYIIILCLALGCLESRAQDTKVSHPFMWKSFNNPGYSGFDGLMSANFGMQRAFWGHPLNFQSYFLSLDMPFREKRVFGLGGTSLFFQRDQESSVNYVTNMVSGVISVRARIMRNTVLQLGLQPCFYQKSLDASKFVLGDQLDPYYGKIMDLSPEMVKLYSDKVNIFDFAVGLYGKTDLTLRYGSIASVEYGFSVYHVIEPSQSFMSEHGSLAAEDNLINRRMSAYLSYAHPAVLSAEFNTVVSPYLMYEKQGNMQNLQIGAYWEEERYGLVGMALKQDQYGGFSFSSLMFHLGLNVAKTPKQNFRICYTFETPTNQGTICKNTSHSLSIHWLYKRNPARETRRFDNSPNNKRTKQKKIECDSKWFGRD